MPTVSTRKGALEVAVAEPRRWREALMFLILSVLIWPVIATGFVGTYGLAFWIYFMLAGPPGPR
ncbi:MAG: periplasmic nitrate reductase NapE [Acetobacteraceae bacterium]|nr:periplasmic nitrate reductase NapE [Acetobacteraceae bacterium]